MRLLRLLSISLMVNAFSQVAWADQITLKSTSGSIELNGEFIGFDNGAYLIETDLGQLEVDARTVTCSGTACPDIESLASEFTILGNQTLIDDLLVPLLESYSFSLDADIQTEIETVTASRIKITAHSGQEFAKISIKPEDLSDIKSALTITSGTAKALSSTTDKSRKIPIAADALVAVTSGINPVKSISLAALQNILSGTITNWKDIGGPDAAINVYLPMTSSSLSQIAMGLGFDFSKLQNAKRFADIEALSKTAANDPYSLGFTNFTSRRTARALPIVGSCGAYMRPNVFNISSGSYPTAFYHYLAAKPDTLPIFAREFLDYLDEPQAKSMIDRQGYPSLSVHENNLDNQGNRIVHGLLGASGSLQAVAFRSMLDTLNGARQLSTILRFNPDGIHLTPQSTIALNALISELFLGNYADQTLIIAGFTDSKQSLAASSSLSKAAAVTIANLIKNADNDNLFSALKIEVHGYGQASPLACEDTVNGITINNRVEIWVKDNL